MTERMPQGGLPLVLLAGNGQEATRWLRGLLEEGGYAVLQERSGQHALERARTTEPDVILVDAELPDMAGIELCRTLRADPRVSTSTPILLTIRDAATRTQRLAALRAGAWECIAPPHDADEILLKIGAYVHAKLDADRARTEGLLDALTGLYNRQGLARRARELGSQAFREHGPLACVVLALDLDPAEPGAAQQQGGTSLGRCVQAIKAAARLSDVIGRLSATEFAVLAPGTDAGGARRLAERLASSVSATTVASAAGAAGAAAPVRVRCGYEAVANVGYAPIEPVDLLVRAAAAVRTGRADSGSWLRRFDEGANPTPTTP
jgi:diguanylate cyclase (GGDEF)-like protein